MNPLSRSISRALGALALLALGLVVTGVFPDARAQAQIGSPEQVRPEIAKPLLDAQELIKAKNYGAALGKIGEAERIADRTPHESYMIAQTRAAAAAGAGDAALILASLEALVATGRMPPTEQLKAIESIAGTYYQRENFSKAAEWSSRYFKDGGADPKMRTMLARSLYFNDDFGPAANVLRADLDADEMAGRTPTQERVQMLASCYIKMNDSVGYVFALEKMLAYYPKKEYWGDAIRRVETRPGFSDRFALDVLRLLNATGNLSSAAQHMAMAQLALQAGFPAEAKRIIDQGFASGVLGTGADADRQKKLRDSAAKQAAEDDKALALSVKDAGAAKDGTALVNVGFAFVNAGQYDKGIALMEQGIQKGGLKRPDDARLHLGIAYHFAGQKAKAVDAFKTVQGTDGAADLARLWAIHAQRPPG